MDRIATLAITICATRDYLYAIRELAARVQSNLIYTTRSFDRILIILSGDESEELRSAARLFDGIVPRAEVCERAQPLPAAAAKNYDPAAQLMIAVMRSAAFGAARAAGADLCWSLDSDVLPPENALECMLDVLAFDRGYYGVASCPYPSQGGGDFLGGRGTPQRPILPDVYEDEREISPRMARALKLRRERLAEAEAEEFTGGPRRAEAGRKLHRLERRMEKSERYRPKGNIFARLAAAQEWRRRGWLSSAYPAIGIGAVVPADWCGMGCTLMGRPALAAALLDGYQGHGTEDLYIIWHRWHPRGLRIACLPHAPCDHIIRERAADGGQDLARLAHIQSFHETAGECIGHLRMRRIPFPP